MPPTEVAIPEIIPPSPDRSAFSSQQRHFLETLDPLKEASKRLTLEDISLRVQQLREEKDLIHLSDRERQQLRPEVFVLAGRAVELITGMSPWDNQYVCANALANGKIAELPSGEGKTIATGIATIYQALTHKNTVVLTANDYLAKRDAAELAQIYEVFGLKTGVIFGEGKDVMEYNPDPEQAEDPINFPNMQRVPFDENLPYSAHQEIYGTCNPIYGTPRSLIFDEQVDALTDNPQLQRQTRPDDEESGKRVAVEKDTETADEVDNLGVDNALTEQILSNLEQLSLEERIQILFAQHVALRLPPPVYATIKGKQVFKTGEYTIEDVNSFSPTVQLTHEGWDRVLSAYKMLPKDFFAENSPYPQLIRNAVLVNAKSLRTDGTIAFEPFKKDDRYIVTPDSRNPSEMRVILIDPKTGRPLLDNVLSYGIHQALEAKEFGKDHPEFIRGPQHIIETTSLPTYFNSFREFAGTTGTAQGAREAFDRFYHREIEVIPPNQPLQLRKWATEIIFSPGTAPDINTAVRNRAIQVIHMALLHSMENTPADQAPKIQPFLVVAESDGEAEALHQALTESLQDMDEGSRPRVRLLTASTLEHEAKIIAQAGEVNTITITTALAGRGTHIELGGKKPQIDGKPAPRDSQIYKNWEELHDEVVGLNGLFVLALKVPVTARELEQLARRAARHGEPGMFKIIASIHSEPFRIFHETQASKFAASHDILGRAYPNPARYDYMIERVQAELETRYLDQIEDVVIVDNARQVAKKKLRQEIATLREDPLAVLDALPESIHKVLEEQLSFLQTYSIEQMGGEEKTKERINAALNIAVGTPENPLNVQLTTVEAIDGYLLNQAQGKAKIAGLEARFTPLVKMQGMDQRDVIEQFLLWQIQQLRSFDTHRLESFITTALRRTDNATQEFLAAFEILRAQAYNEKLPYSVLPLSADEWVKKYITRLHLAAFPQLVSKKSS